MAGDEISEEQARNDAGSTSDSGADGQAHGQGRSYAWVGRPHIPTIRAADPVRLSSKTISTRATRTDPSPRCDRSWLTRRVASGAIQPAPAGRLLTAWTGTSPNIEPQASQPHRAQRPEESRYCK